MRPNKSTLSFFNHHVSSSEYQLAMEIKYGTTAGYAYWYKMGEMLAGSENHMIDLNRASYLNNVIMVMGESPNKIRSIFEYMASIGGISKVLWKKRVVWSKFFYNIFIESYKRRAGRPLGEKELINIYESKASHNSVDLEEEIRLEDNQIKLAEEITTPIKNGGGTKKLKKIIKGSKKKVIPKRNITKEAKVVIDYLNTKLAKKKGRGFSDTSMIEATLRRGATIEQCKTVIDNKIQDPYFIENPRYMNPVTLFRKKHWDVYLTQTPDVLQKNGDEGGKVSTAYSLRNIEVLKDKKADIERRINELIYEINRTPGKIAREKAEKSMAILEAKKDEIVKSIISIEREMAG